MPVNNMTPEQINGLFKNGKLNQGVYEKLISGPGFSSKSDALTSAFGPKSIQKNNILDRSQKNSPESKRAFAEAAGVPKSIIDQKLGSNNDEKLGLASDLTPQAPNKLGLTDAASPYDAAYDKQIRGVRDEARAMGAKTNAQAEILNDGEFHQNQQELYRANSEAKRFIARTNKIAAMEKQVQEIAGMEIDPGRFWADKSTGDKVATGIALFLGSFGPGSDNKVALMLNDAVDKDIALQQNAIDNKRSSLKDNSSLLGQMREVYGDEVAAREAAKLAALEKVQMQTMKKAMQYSSPEVNARALRLEGEIEQKKLEHKQKFIQAMNDPMYGMTHSERLSHRKDIGGRTLSGTGLVNIQTGEEMANNDRDAYDLRTAKTTFDPIRANLAELVELVSGGLFGAEREFFNTDLKTRASVLATELHLQLKNKDVEALGVLTGPDMGLLTKLVPEDPTAIFQINADTRLKKSLEIMEDRWDFYTKARGLVDPSVEEVRGSRIKSEKE